jgi:proliferating cell nuclear antigen
MTSNNEQYILNLKTVQSSNIKTLFEVLKEVLLGDINMIFTPNNIKVVEMNESRMAMVYLNLQSEAFEQYHCEREIHVGLNTTNFYKIIKIAKNSDTISFFIDKDQEDFLGIRMENRDDNRIFEAKIPLLDIGSPIMEIPKLEYPTVISLPSVKFQKYIKDLNSLGTDCKLDITSVGQQLTFSCRGDFSENKAIFGNSDDTKFDNETPFDVIQGTFSLKFLILFTKATSLCQTVQIYMKNDFSIILEYCVGSLGSLRFILSPIQ